MPPEDPINRKDCDIYLASPVQYEECVILAEHAQGLFFVLTDEERNGQCVIEFPNLNATANGWKIKLSDLRLMLQQAEELLVGAK
jgi:hypothetical protein